MIDSILLFIMIDSILLVIMSVLAVMGFLCMVDMAISESTGILAAFVCLLGIGAVFCMFLRLLGFV
jgi:hypothetical protein